ncbi:MAG: hypothetical protein IT198_00255, partial [Acidimicrobiia bacterium]|nr:hypothetical protein [Acidimicrobiia bacterium]
MTEILDLSATAGRAPGRNRRRKVYVGGSRPDIRVPVCEVELDPSPLAEGQVPNPPFRLYDTSGPGSDVHAGLPPLRRPWILERGDVAEYAGRPARRRDDGRGAVR